MTTTDRPTLPGIDPNWTTHVQGSASRSPGTAHYLQFSSNHLFIATLTALAV